MEQSLLQNSTNDNGAAVIIGKIRDNIWIENYVQSIRLLLEQGQSEENQEQVEEKKTELEFQIKNEVNENLKILTKQVDNFFQTQKKMIEIKKKIAQFDQYLEKLSSRKMYDAQDMEKKQRALKNIIETQKVIKNTQKTLQLLYEGEQNMKRENYAAVIRGENKLNNQKIQIPVMRVYIQESIRFWNSKINIDMDSMIQNWTSYSREIQFKQGHGAFRSFEPLVKQLQTSTQMALSGNKSIVNNSRSSVYSARESNISRFSNRQSIMSNIISPQEVKNMWDPFQQLSGDNSSKTVSRVSLVKGVNQFTNREVNFQIKVDFTQLKTPLQIYDMLGQSILFFEGLKANRQRLAFELQFGEQNHDSAFMRKYLTEITGFIIIEKEINKVIIQKKRDLDVMVLDTIELVKKVMNNYFKNLKSQEDFMQTKQDGYVFCFILKSMGFSSSATQILKVLKDSLIYFSQEKRKVSLEKLRSLIFRDTFLALYVENDIDRDTLCKIYEITLPKDSKGKIKKVSQKGYEMPFSSIMKDILEQLQEFQDECINYLRGLGQNDQVIYSDLDIFFQQICTLFEESIEKGQVKQTILQLCQTVKNLGYLQSAASYFHRQLESLLSTSSNKEFKCFRVIEQSKIKCKKIMLDEICRQIDSPLQNYKNFKWEVSEKEVRTQPTDFVQELISFLRGTFLSMKVVSEQISQELIFQAFQHINDQFWNYLLNSCKAFNQVGLINFELDLLELFHSCGSDFGEYGGLMECLREIRQFLDIFLVSKDVNELMEPGIKEKKYGKLSYANLVKILPQYVNVKIKFQGYNEVKKRDVDQILKKIREKGY